MALERQREIGQHGALQRRQERRERNRRRAIEQPRASRRERDGQQVGARAARQRAIDDEHEGWLGHRELARVEQGSSRRRGRAPAPRATARALRAGRHLHRPAAHASSVVASSRHVPLRRRQRAHRRLRRAVDFHRLRARRRAGHHAHRSPRHTQRIGEQLQRAPRSRRRPRAAPAAALSGPRRAARRSRFETRAAARARGTRTTDAPHVDSQRIHAILSAVAASNIVSTRYWTKLKREVCHDRCDVDHAERRDESAKRAQHPLGRAVRPAQPAARAEARQP